MVANRERRGRLGNGTSQLATTSRAPTAKCSRLSADVPSWVATTTLATISGTLGVGNGGTGATTFSYGLLYSPGGTSAIANLATSSLNLLTTDIIEGSKLFYTDARVQSFIHASSTIPKTYSDNTFTGSTIFSGSISALGSSQFANSSNFFGPAAFGATATTTIATNGTISTPSIIANTAAAFAASFGATATSTFSSTGALSLAGGLTLSGSPNGPLHANAGVVSATTSIGVLYGGTGLTSAPTYGQLLVGNSSGGYTLTATSSLGITGGSSLFTDGGITTYLTSSDVLGVGTTTAWSKLAVFGDLFVEGSSRYLNFGTATGTSGYGFRDNAGTLEFKNSGGSWQGVTTATSGPSFSVHKNGTNQTVTAEHVRHC